MRGLVARHSAAFAGVVVLMAEVSACLPGGVCLVQTNINGKVGCALSTCANGSEFDVNTNACACRMGLHSVHGQCMTQSQADEFCGSGNTWKADGCVAKTCPEGQELDQGSGECREVAAVAAAIGVTLKPGETIGCAEGQRLVTDGSTAACIPVEQTCARDERFDGSRCVKERSCPTGAAPDPTTGECVAYGSSGTTSYQVDVRSWAQTNYGKDGGMGAPGFCGTFARRPWMFGVSEGQSAMLQIKLALSFPGGDVASGAVQAMTTFDGGAARAVPKAGADAVAKAADDVLARLRSGGGSPDPSDVTVTVRCPVVSAAKPAAIPAVGGF